MNGRFLCALAWLTLAQATAFADVRLPRLLSDGVVLQRDAGAALWADPTLDRVPAVA